MGGTPGASCQTAPASGVPGGDFHSPLSSSDLNNDPFAVFGVCVAGVVVRELTEIKGAEEWLHAFLGAHELHQALPPAEGIAAKRRF